MKHNSSKSLVLIANLTAGAGRGDRRRLVAMVVRHLRRHGFAVRLHIEANPHDVTARAHHATMNGTDCIVAAGGDGTINAVVNGMMEAGKSSNSSCRSALGVLPLGTGNVLARNLKIPLFWRDACRVICSGHPMLIDLGHACQISPDTNQPGAKDAIFC